MCDSRPVADGRFAVLGTVREMSAHKKALLAGVAESYEVEDDFELSRILSKNSCGLAGLDSPLMG